jgi:antitoxin component YwqK of YwqJK toxin-antitoxin module
MRIKFEDIQLKHPDIGGGNVFYYLDLPFTGIVVEYDENNNLMSEISVVESHTHGRVASFYSNGQIEEEYFEKNNKMYGFYRKWDENGKLVIEYDYGLET